MEYIAVFLLWTFMIYWIHRAVHDFNIPYMSDFHWDHHKQVTNENTIGLHWTNMLLINDNIKSTLDLWCTEIIPTIVFCWLTGHWWILIGYYIWAAFIQEAIEHNKNFDWYPFMTSGKWHLEHHKDHRVNLSLFVPIWDILFKTHKKHNA